MVQKEILSLLKRIKKMSPEQFAVMIDSVTDKTIDDLCECIFNVINTDLGFSRKKKKCLKNHIHKNCSTSRLKNIATRKTPLSKRRKMLKQEGKGLPLLLGSLIPLITSLFSR